MDERIDHRSHTARGIDEQPTTHEGVIARAMEQKGIISDRCEIIRQIKADNKLLRELKAQVERLVKAIKDTIPVIAEAMETVRRNMLIFGYQLRHTRAAKSELYGTLDAILPDFRRYTGIAQKLEGMAKQRQALLPEKKATPILHITKHIELSHQIATLTEDMEELRSKKNMLQHSFGKSDDAGMKKI